VNPIRRLIHFFTRRWRREERSSVREEGAEVPLVTEEKVPLPSPEREVTVRACELTALAVATAFRNVFGTPVPRKPLLKRFSARPFYTLNYSIGKQRLREVILLYPAPPETILATYYATAVAQIWDVAFLLVYDAQLPIRYVLKNVRNELLPTALMVPGVRPYLHITEFGLEQIRGEETYVLYVVDGEKVYGVPRSELGEFKPCRFEFMYLYMSRDRFTLAYTCNVDRVYVEYPRDVEKYLKLVGMT